MFSTVLGIHVSPKLWFSIVYNICEAFLWGHLPSLALVPRMCPSLIPPFHYFCFSIVFTLFQSALIHVFLSGSRLCPSILLQALIHVFLSGFRLCPSILLHSPLASFRSLPLDRPLVSLTCSSSKLIARKPEGVAVTSCNLSTSYTVFMT